MAVKQTGENKWQIDYRDDKHIRYRETIYGSKNLAQTVLAKRKVEIAEGKFLNKLKKNRIKFKDFAQEYLELHSKQNNKSWQITDVRQISVLNRVFAEMYLDQITPYVVEKYKAQRVQEVQPPTVNRQLACLKSIFNKAIGWGKFQGPNPVKPVKLFKENNERIRFLEKDEIVRLLSCCNKYLKGMIIIALNTGMRRGEILDLKWRDVDVKRGVIYLYNTKNREKREIPINEQVKTALIRTKKHPQSEYIFYKRDGSPFGGFRKSFFTACKKSGIKDFHFHDLRHTFASHLVMSGVDLNTVRELLGHKTMKMTLRYSHLSPSHKQRAVDVLSRKMDTFWTLDPKADSSEEKGLSLTPQKTYT